MFEAVDEQEKIKSIKRHIQTRGKFGQVAIDKNKNRFITYRLVSARRLFMQKNREEEYDCTVPFSRNQAWFFQAH